MHLSNDRGVNDEGDRAAVTCVATVGEDGLRRRVYTLMGLLVLVGALSSACVSGAGNQGRAMDRLTRPSSLRTEVGSHVVVEADAPLYRDVERHIVAFRTAEPTTMRIVAAGSGWARLKTKPRRGSHCFGGVSGLESVDVSVYARPEDLARVNREPVHVELDDDATVIVRPGARLTSADGGWRVHARGISLETDEIRSVGRRYEPASPPTMPNSRLLDGDSLPDALDGLQGMPGVTGGREFAHSVKAARRLELYDGCVIARLTGQRLERVRPPRMVNHKGRGGWGGGREIPAGRALFWKDGRSAGETTRSLLLGQVATVGQSSRLVCAEFVLHEKPTTRARRTPKPTISTVLWTELVSRGDDETQPSSDETPTESTHLCFYSKSEIGNRR